MREIMERLAYMTTSWDDGHPSDFRVAELLARYGQRGTFYLPRSAETETIDQSQVRDLATSFEVGGHTVHHVTLTEVTDAESRREIAESRHWLEDISGQPCRMFCPPRGKYRRRHLDMIREAGYSGMRTVELLSLDFPRPTAGLMVMPTTVQSHPHGFGGYFRNVIRRAAVRNLWYCLLHGAAADWFHIARSLLAETVRRGGVFHLWGHSWELDEAGQWGRLEDTLRLMSEYTAVAPTMTNGDIVAMRTNPTRQKAAGKREAQRGLAGTRGAIG
jgi:hypothetical protein